MNRKLYIHIGSHKTGTTSIQRTLYENRGALKKRRITFFCITPEGARNPTGNSSDWIRFDCKDLVHSTIHHNLADKLGDTGTNVLISTEYFSWLFDNDTVRTFHENLCRHFTEFKVICYLRRQDRQLVSHYQQASRAYNTPAYWFFGSQNCALPTYQPHFDCYLDYYKRLGFWGDVFGDANMAIRIFEPRELVDGDAVNDFFNVINVPLGRTYTRENKSRGFVQTKAGHLMNQSGITYPHRPPIERQLNAISALSGSRLLLPTRSSAMALYDRYKEGNRKLNERFQVNAQPWLFDEDFSRYPEEKRDEWDEASANDAILSILKGVRDIPFLEEHEIDLVRDLAVKLENKDSLAAHALMQIANKFRPQGPFIRNKLAELKERVQIRYKLLRTLFQ